MMLIRAFAKIASKYPDYTLFIYGEGPLRRDLEILIKTLHLGNQVFYKDLRRTFMNLYLMRNSLYFLQILRGFRMLYWKRCVWAYRALQLMCQVLMKLFMIKSMAFLSLLEMRKKMVQAMDLLVQSPKLREEISIHGIETGKTFLLILFARNGLRLYSIKLFMFYDNGYLK